VVVDNASSFPEWAEDMVCRFVTGEADSKRQLYTDDDDIIYELKRAVLLNSINPPSERGDVQDRLLPLELERISEERRRPEEEMWARFAEIHPKLLGDMFDVLAETLAVIEQGMYLWRSPRLADWGKYAAAVYVAVGWSVVQFLDDWDEVVERQTSAALEGSPIGQAVIRFMEDNEHWRGTGAELLPKLEKVVEEKVTKEKEWPKSSRWVWKRIKEVVPSLSVAGIETKYHPIKQQSNEIELRRSRISNGSNGSNGSNRVDKPDSGTHYEESNGSANGSNVTPLSFDLRPGESATLEELRERRKGITGEYGQVVSPEDERRGRIRDDAT
jgi:hypothetical protein